MVVRGICGYCCYACRGPLLSCSYVVRLADMLHPHFLPPDNNRESLFLLGFSSILSLSPLDELVLLELASEDVRPRDMVAAPMMSSSRTSSCGDVV